MVGLRTLEAREPEARGVGRGVGSENKEWRGMEISGSGTATTTYSRGEIGVGI